MQSLEELSYDVAVRALGQQERLLDDLRARTATLLTAAALIGSFLGAQAIRLHGLSGWVILAFAAFALTIVLTVYVLLPKAKLIFALDASQVYEGLYEVHDNEAEVHRRLAYWIQTFRLENQPAIRRMTLAFRVAAGTLLLELALLGLD